MKIFPQRRAVRKREGFTILELLVSAVVLGLMTTFTVSLVSNVSLTTDRTHRRMDADSSARTALERIATDFDRMLKRPDVNYGFYKSSGDDSLCFYATSPSFGSFNRQVSVVHYRINSRLQLECGVKTIADSSWETPIFVSGSSQVLDLEDFSDESATTLVSPDDYQGLGDDVMRLELAYLINDPVNGVKIDTVPPSRFADLRGLVVAVAVLDAKSRALLSDDQLASIADLLGDAQKDTAILPLWESALKNPIGNAKVALAASNLRFYQRYYFFQ